jgi:hypothetical protein
MEDQNSVEESKFEEFDKVSLYSKKAIMGFSICFTTIFGGVLLMQNLKDIGKKKEANIVLGISFIYTILSIILVNFINSTNSSKTFIFNVFGGVLLSHYFFTKYIPNEESYRNKPIWKPLIISILITIPFIWALIYSIKNN